MTGENWRQWPLTGAICQHGRQRDIGRTTVPMNDMVRAALSHAEKAATTDYVVEWAGGPIKRLRTGFNAAVKAVRGWKT